MFGEEISVDWCTQNSDDWRNICDGSLADCWMKGMEKCADEALCYGVMVNPGWTAAYKGVQWCKSSELSAKGDWVVRMKLTGDFIIAES